jgi:hypothetical protein
MRELLVIFRKDVKHLWPLGAAVSALVILHGWVDLRLEFSFLHTLNMRWHEYEPWLLFLGWWCLVAILMQQERTVGDRQYWLTRPISGAALVGAKGLFLVAFICVPSFLAQTAVLIATGFSVAEHFPALAWNQVLIFCYFLVAGALAAVTRSFRQYAVASLAVFAAFTFVETWKVNTDGGQWEGVQWAQEAASQIVIVAAGAVVFGLQYTGRRTVLSRSILGAGLVVTSLLLWTDWWHAAFALTSAVKGPPDQASKQIRVAFDETASPPPDLNRPLDGSAMPFRIGAPVRIAVPVRVTGVPSGRELLSERVSVTLQGLGGAAWNSGWRVSNELSERTIWRNSDEWLTGDGTYWLSFDVPAAYFERVKDEPVRVLASVALSEFTSPAVTHLPAKPRQFPVPGLGHCSMDTINREFTMVSCVVPFQNRAAVDFRIQPHTGASWELSGCCTISYVPFETGGHFSLWGDVGSMPSGTKRLSPDDAVSIEMRRPVSFFERGVGIGNIHLARYEVRAREGQ